MLASHCCKILSDGKAPCNELMLHHTRQCTGASCKMLQMLRGLDSNSRPKTKILYTDAFTQRYFHKNSFYTVVSTYTCVYPKMVLHTNTFTHRCFAQGCFFTKILLHARAFTQGFFWHKVAFTHKIFLHRKIHLYKNVFKHTDTLQR